MEIELERTYLLKSVPPNLDKCGFREIVDTYLPQSVEHPKLRIRRFGDVFEITKKAPLVLKDSSRQGEETISLSQEEYRGLCGVGGKEARKVRYYFPYKNTTAEIDVFQDDLKGLVLVDFEFETMDEKDRFIMPDFCLAEVTQEKGLAGGMLAGKKYSDLEAALKKYGYKKIDIEVKAAA